jgi:hypothetical protein
VVGFVALVVGYLAEGDRLPAVAQTTQRPAMTECGVIALIKPTTIKLACGDGGSRVSNISWKAWTRTEAAGPGSYYWNPCQPACSAGTIKRRSAYVVLDQPSKCSDGKVLFRRVRLFTSAQRSSTIESAAVLPCLNKTPVVKPATTATIAFTGIGLLQLGMTEQQVQNITKQTVQVTEAVDCMTTDERVIDDGVNGVAARFENNAAVYIDTDSQRWKTETGVGVGSTDQQLIKAYGTALQAIDFRHEDGAPYGWWLASPDAATSIGFVVYDKIVTGIFVQNGPVAITC